MAETASIGPLQRWGATVVVAFATVARIGVVVAILVQPSDDDAVRDYVDRFGEISVAGGTPYRDHPVEYPPVSLGAIELVGDEDDGSTSTRLLWFTVLVDALLAAVLAWGWGRGAAAAYLGASVLVLPAIYQTLDILPAALAAAGVTLARRHRERTGGLVLAAAVLAKVWPVALIPGLLVWGRRRALAWSLGALLIGTTLWVVWAGPEAPGQVATQRHSPGWEVESTIGAFVWILGDGEVRIVKDSPRIGTAPAWAETLLAVATVLGICGIWLRTARAGDRDRVGGPSLACVALLMFLAPIYSYPYVLWLLPWAAIAWSERRIVSYSMVLGVVVLTTLAYAMLNGGVNAEAPWAIQLVLVIRNGLTGAIAIAYLLSTRERVSSIAGVPAPRVP
jgi:hypothetical protein